LEPDPDWREHAKYRTAHGLAWSARGGVFRVCDVTTGRLIVEREIR
jgi:hypothetical protein